MIYKAVVTGNTLATSKEKGTPSVEIQVRTSQEVGGDAVAMTLTGSIWLTSKTTERAIETLDRVFGWNGNSFSELNNPILKGIECEITVEESEYNGKPQKKIAFFNRPGESGTRAMTAIDDTQARSIASQFDSALRAYKAKGGLVTAPTKTTTQTAPEQKEKLPWE